MLIAIARPFYMDMDKIKTCGIVVVNWIILNIGIAIERLRIGNRHAAAVWIGAGPATSHIFELAPPCMI